VTQSIKPDGIKIDSNGNGELPWQHSTPHTFSSKFAAQCCSLCGHTDFRLVPSRHCLQQPWVMLELA
jgi:hypothetical protein